MIETENERMNKRFLVLGCAVIVLVALAAIFVLSNESEEADVSSDTNNIRDVEDAGGGVVVVQSETELKAEPAKTEGSKTETIKSKIEEISLSGKTGPGKTVEAYWIAIAEQRYDDAVSYYAETPSWLSKWKLKELTDAWLAQEGINEEALKKIEILEVEYFDKSKTMARVSYRVAGYHQESNLEKKEGAWKVVSSE